jgi:putative thioredoxin
MSDNLHVIEVSSERFSAEVIEKSREVPVLVDFWADWCAPCRMLMPVLAKLATEYAGRFVLTKVNTDSEQQIAGQLGIRSLPTVILFRDGKPVDQFMGAQPEGTVRAFLERHLPAPADAGIDRARVLHDAGRSVEAAELLHQAIEADPDRDDRKLLLARIQIDQGELDAARATLARLSAPMSTNRECDALQSRIQFAAVVAAAAPEAELEQRIDQNPGDSEARYQLSARWTLAERFDEAMEQLLEIVRRDRGFNDDAGRRGLLGVFAMLGHDDERVSRYRSLLSRSMN